MVASVTVCSFTSQQWISTIYEGSKEPGFIYMAARFRE